MPWRGLQGRFCEQAGSSYLHPVAICRGVPGTERPASKEHLFAVVLFSCRPLMVVIGIVSLALPNFLDMCLISELHSLVLPNCYLLFLHI